MWRGWTYLNSPALRSNMVGANKHLHRLARELHRQFAALRTCVAGLDPRRDRECLRWVEATIDAANECEGVIAQLADLSASPPAPTGRTRGERARGDASRGPKSGR